MEFGDDVGKGFCVKLLVFGYNLHQHLSVMLLSKLSKHLALNAFYQLYKAENGDVARILYTVLIIIHIFKVQYIHGNNLTFNNFISINLASRPLNYTPWYKVCILAIAIFCIAPKFDRSHRRLISRRDGYSPIDREDAASAFRGRVALTWCRVRHGWVIIAWSVKVISNSSLAQSVTLMITRR